MKDRKYRRREFKENNKLYVIIPIEAVYLWIQKVTKEL